MNEGWDPAALDPEGVNSQRESQRIDYFFTWRDTASAIPWTSADDVVDSAVVVLAVDVQGGRVTRYSREFRRPENFDGVSLPPLWAGANGIFISAAIVLAFAMALAPKRRRLVRWRPALIATTIVLVLSAVAGLDALVGGFHDSSTATFGSYVVAQVGAMLGVGLFLGIFFVMLAMAATTLARDVYPAAVAAYEHLMTGRWQPRAVGPIVGVGYVIGFALIGVVGLTEVALGPLSTSSDFGELGWLAYTDESIPFLAMPASSAIGGIAASLAILLALSLGRHLFKSTLMAVAVPTVLIPLLSTPLILNGKPDVLIIGTMALAGMLTVWRFGVVAGVVAFTVLDGADNFHLMASGDGFYVTSGILAWVLLLLPGAVAAIAYLRAGPAPSPVAVVRN